MLKNVEMMRLGLTGVWPQFYFNWKHLYRIRGDICLLHITWKARL